MVGEKNFSYDSNNLINSSDLDVNMAKLNVNTGFDYNWLADSRSMLYNK
jgi:hypothetical protein